jgi:phage/plasmid primase-like uncharacterized protein
MVTFATPIDCRKPPADPVMHNVENPGAAFMDELRSYGFHDRGRPLPGLPIMGEFVRISSPDDKPGRKAGWYIFNEIPDDYRPGAFIGIGVFGNWKGYPERVVWSSKRRESMSPIEVARLEAQIVEAKRLRDEALALQRAEAATKAKASWAEAIPALPEYPYLAAKGIQPHGARVADGKLMIPVMNGDDLVSLQYIDATGEKKFLFHGRTKGCFHVIGAEESDIVRVAEGFATGATLHELTGDMVYVCFNTGNIMDVVGKAKDRHPEAIIIICGDDDHGTVGNPGRAKANAAGDVHRCAVVYPEFGKKAKDKDTDFNDMVRLYGADAVKELLQAKPQVYERDLTYAAMPENLLNPPGILGDIASYYNATARAPQPGFAVQTALAVASVVLGRHFRTSEENFTSLYFLNVAKSGTGKEHAKTVAEKILRTAELDRLINGGGYTSAGAVFSTLLWHPRHITIIDEFGRYLGAAQGNKNTNLQEANTQLMEAIGRCQGVMKPVAYSTMTLSKEKQDEFSNRKIVNPAISMICMTTPVALFKNLTSDNIADGFLGRFIISHSDAPRMVHTNKGMIDVPHRIVDWIEKINERSGQNIGTTDIAGEAPTIVTIPFTGEALAVLSDLDEYRVKMCDHLEQCGMEALPARLHEMGMKMSLIVGLADDPNLSAISEAHAKWACDYVRDCLDRIVAVFRTHISSSVHEGDKKEILESLRDAGTNGVTWGEMQGRPPFSKHKRKDLTEILDALADGGLILDTRVQSGTRGRPREAFVALA